MRDADLNPPVLYAEAAAVRIVGRLSLPILEHSLSVVVIHIETVVPSPAVRVPISPPGTELVGAGGQQRVASYFCVPYRPEILLDTSIHGNTAIGDAATQRIIVLAPF